MLQPGQKHLAAVGAVISCDKSRLRLLPDEVKKLLNPRQLLQRVWSVLLLRRRINKPSHYYHHSIFIHWGVQSCRYQLASDGEESLKEHKRRAFHFAVIHTSVSAVAEF